MLGGKLFCHVRVGLKRFILILSESSKLTDHQYG